MSFIKFTDLPSIATIADADLFCLVDMSDNTSKSVTSSKIALYVREYIAQTAGGLTTKSLVPPTITATNPTDYLSADGTWKTATSGSSYTLSDVSATGDESIIGTQVLNNFKLKKLTAGANVSLTATANDITIDFSGSLGLVDSASNIGAGVGVFKQLATKNLEFKSLVAGTNVSLSADANTITINVSSAATGLLDLNGEIGSTQTFAVGSTGTDFNVNSSLNVHTFNIPTASTSNRGLLSTTDWDTFSAKVEATRIVGTQHSLTGGGNLGADLTLNLVGDVASPGNSKYYGTDGAGARGFYDLPAPGGGGLVNAYTIMTDGETPTAASGADTFKFRTANNKLALVTTNNDATHGDNLLFTVQEANIIHDNLSGFVANEHIDHSAVSIATQYSLTGGGDITLTRTLSLVNDEATPTASKYYGTNGAGAKGWHALPSTAGINTLNAQTGTTQTFAVGTSGTNFNISSATNVHTFNLPTASATLRGALSQEDWSRFDAKVPTTISVTGGTSLTGGGDLSTNRVITLLNDSGAPGSSKYYGTNGAGNKGWYALPGGGSGISSLNTQTGATQTLVVGSAGTDFVISSAANVHTFNIPTASSTNRGLLSSANWTTFNNKVPTTRSISTTNSLTGGGNLSANRTLSLVNDVGSPGSNQYYGTNGAGTKGFFALPTASPAPTPALAYTIDSAINLDTLLRYITYSKDEANNTEYLVVGKTYLAVATVEVVIGWGDITEGGTGTGAPVDIEIRLIQQVSEPIIAIAEGARVSTGYSSLGSSIRNKTLSIPMGIVAGTITAYAAQSASYTISTNALKFIATEELPVICLVAQLSSDIGNARVPINGAVLQITEVEAEDSTVEDIE